MAEAANALIVPNVAGVLSGLRPERVALIRKAIDFKDRLAIGQFGARAQQAATSFADRILAQTRGQDLGDPEVILNAMLAKAQELDVKPLRNPGFMSRIMGSAKVRIERFGMQFTDVSGAIDGMGVEIERHRVALRSDISTLEGLYDETMVSIHELDEHIEAATLEIDEMRVRTIPAMRSETGGGETDRMMLAQRTMDMEQATDRLEKRVVQLRQARQIAFQQLPQIRIIQSGDETLIQNLDAALDLTIPAWKQKMVVILGLARQRRALEMDKAIAGATGRMIVETAELVRSQSFEIEERSQQGLVDLDALETANAVLIDTLRGLSARQA
jgi:uncharacterized protein YaaN involved in tellurite resistance